MDSHFQVRRCDILILDGETDLVSAPRLGVAYLQMRLAEPGRASNSALHHDSSGLDHAASSRAGLVPDYYRQELEELVSGIMEHLMSFDADSEAHAIETETCVELLDHVLRNQNFALTS